MQVEVRNITKQISELNNKLDSVNQLAEPRENSYMVFCRNEDEDYTEHIRNLLRNVGSVKTSKTFPSLCRASLETVICHLETRAKLQTIDYNGMMQELGGDPVTAGNCLSFFGLLLNILPLSRGDRRERGSSGDECGGQ